MGNPKFEIHKGTDGQYWFRLVAGNGEKALKSEGYVAKQSCKNGIQSVRVNAPDDSRYTRKVTNDGEPYFNLIAVNGETIGTSETYSSKQAMEKGIAAVKHDAPGASIEDYA